MEPELLVVCGDENEFGTRLASVTRNGHEYVARVRLADAYDRVCFAGRALRQFGCELTAERLAGLDLQLMRSMREAEERPAYVDEPQIVRLSDVKAEEVDWLWPGRIARGAITLLAGDPGLGKSLVTLDVAARVSRGEGWPDGERAIARPASVVLLNGEDDLRVTIRPRLEALGADLQRIVTIAPQRNLLTGEEPPPFELDRDLDELRRTVARVGDCALVVIDPISAFLGRTGECSNADVRRLLAPLAELARRKRLAVVIVSHLRKDLGAAVRRTLGSMAFVAAARAAWVVSRDAARPERRLFLPVKNNLATEVGGLAFEVVGSKEESLSGKPQCEDVSVGGVAVVKWSAERIGGHVDELMLEPRRVAQRPDTERRQVTSWLRDYFASGPRGAQETREAAAASGFSYGTLRRAFEELGGVPRKERAERQGGWVWELPGLEGCEEEASAEREEHVSVAAETASELAATGLDLSCDVDRELVRGIFEETELPEFPREAPRLE